jgi:hypothetical protein
VPPKKSANVARSKESKPITARLHPRAERFETSGFRSPGGYPTMDAAEGCYRTLPCKNPE